MSNEQAQNYNILNQRFEAVQSAVDTSTDFCIIRQDVLKLRSGLSDYNLHENAAKKFRGWATKMFYVVNQREKDYNLNILSQIETNNKDLEANPLRSINLSSFHEKIEMLLRWIGAIENILRKKPDKRHVLTGGELEAIKTRILGARGQLSSIQHQRTNQFRQQRENYEKDIAAVEVITNDLEANSPEEELKAAIKNIYQLQDRLKSITKKKREGYEIKIQELLVRCKNIRKEKHEASIQLVSQENQFKYEINMDVIEEKLEEENIPTNKLKQTKDAIFSDLWKPLSEKENSSFKIVLTIRHRNELFNRMRSLLARIDEKRDRNNELIAQCRESKENLSEQIEALMNDFSHYREQHVDNKMNKGDYLRSLNNIKTEIRGCQQQLKAGQFFWKDRRLFYDQLGDLWADVTTVIQYAVSQEWSEDWLMDKLNKNKDQGDIYLKLINDIPGAL